ncbi:hypothetical protein AB0B88_16195 [Micromonospora haikouensis]|uniref:hypothetical protein n=1 Tax=Micromonospora haikouensis TaxID=686309 RepID=UPI0033EB40AC
MRDYEWTITYPGTSFTWGYPWDEVINLTAPDLGAPELRVDDADQPRRDGRLFGVDYRSGTTITFEVGLSTRAGEAAVRDLAERMRQVWRADVLRGIPGAVAELRARHVGRERVTYGRPRRWATVDQLAPRGYIPGVATFETADDLWYGPDVFSETLAITPPLGGGLVGSLSAPLTSTGESDRSQAITVGGALPAWPVITIAGPITNPVVEMVGLWRFELLASLAYDRTVTIDTRPWVRSVVLNQAGGSLAGALTRQSPRLADAGIPPGTYEAVLRGIDATGTARATVAWQETYSSL